MRESETPRVLRPGIFWTLAAVTREPKVLLVRPGLTKPSKKKSAAEMFVKLLHVNPLTLTPVHHNSQLMNSN